jgi:phosphate transport system substrate-binding protein
MPIYQKCSRTTTRRTLLFRSTTEAAAPAGISQLTNGTVDFGASDMPMKGAQINAMTVKPLHILIVMGAVVLIYNIPGVPSDLKCAPDVIADIFTGKIKQRNDRAWLRAGSKTTRQLKSEVYH